MNILQESLIALLSGLATKNEDGSISWEGDKIYPLDIEKQTYIVEHADGDKAWYLNDQAHREDGPAVEQIDGSKLWFLNDQLHRKYGPACEWTNGTKKWYLNGKRHREDGPAVEWWDGDKWWYLNGIKYTEEEWREKLNK